MTDDAIPARTMAAPPPSHGTSVLDLHLGELRQIFNSMDPAPFRERDLDPKASDYIVDWATEMPAKQALSMVVHLGADAGADAPDPAMMGDAVREYFKRRAWATRLQLRKLFRTGRISLVIGLAFLASALLVADALAGLFSRDSFAGLLQESFVIGGWVALWRPIEIFLYGWWPIRAQATLYDRLARMPVRVVSNARQPGAQAVA